MMKGEPFNIGFVAFGLMPQFVELGQERFRSEWCHNHLNLLELDKILGAFNPHQS